MPCSSVAWDEDGRRPVTDPREPLLLAGETLQKQVQKAFLI
jgi:hypothetical protein